MALDARPIMWQAWHWSFGRPKPKELAREFGARAPKVMRFLERFVPLRLAPIAVLRRERDARIRRIRARNEAFRRAICPRTVGADCLLQPR